MESHTCKNCGTQFTGSFCNGCGQRANVSRLTLRSMGKDLFVIVTNVERGFLHTFIQLLIRPARAVQDYIDGKRSVYYNPFRYLFFIIAITLAVFTLSGFSEQALQEGKKGFEQSYQESIQQNMEQGMTEPQAQKAAAMALKWQESYSKFANLQFTNPLLYVILYLPSMSLASWWIWARRKRYNFSEHLAINAFLSGEMSVFSTFCISLVYLVGITDIYTMSLISMMLTIPYYAWFGKTFFGYKILTSVVRSVLFFVVGMVLYTLSLASMAVCFMLVEMLILKK